MYLPCRPRQPRRGRKGEVRRRRGARRGDKRLIRRRGRRKRTKRMKVWRKRLIRFYRSNNLLNSSRFLKKNLSVRFWSIYIFEEKVFVAFFVCYKISEGKFAHNFPS